jgi:hypothetical protein
LAHKLSPYELALSGNLLLRQGTIWFSQSDYSGNVGSIERKIYLKSFASSGRNLSEAVHCVSEFSSHGVLTKVRRQVTTESSRANTFPTQNFYRNDFFQSVALLFLKLTQTTHLRGQADAFYI